MSKKVVIVDYQLGNLFSVKQACEHLEQDTIISSNPTDVLNAHYVILPGVGAFADAMHNLKQLKLDEAIVQFVQKGNPFMGICLGQQLVLNYSEEFEDAKGLGLIEGSVKKIPLQQIDGVNFKVPQIQWNKIKPLSTAWDNTPLTSCSPNDFYYFVHSYYTNVTNPNHVLATTQYGNLTYCSSIKKDNIFTTQFHPEKSGLLGLNIYKNWFNQNK